MIYVHCLFLLALLPCLCAGQSISLSKTKSHLRSGEVREWRTFPAASPGATKSIAFEAQANATEYTLVIRQRDVKNLTWPVILNGQKLGVLQDDERDMVRTLPIPANLLRSGSNTLEIKGERGRFSDDIEIKEIRIETLPVHTWLTQTSVSVRVLTDGAPAPVRLTVVDAEGSLVPFATLRPKAHEAMRTGVLYTPDGVAKIGLPAGEYRIFASRGFEYGAAPKRIKLQSGGASTVELRIRKEVHLPGYISCDTYVHTLELSGHGDASVDERVLTAAGEGLDLIISTEHNKIEDYTPTVHRRNLDQWITAIPGSEVTTAIGHFNIFPTRPGSAPPNPREQDWTTLMGSIWKTDGVQVVVQNHPRDLHSNYRPFDPAHHISATGSNRNGRPVRANAMEVVNSGAMSSDPLQLVRDWLGLLTRGIPMAAVGSSDTHTVDFVPIGQARTYIKADMPETAFRSLAKGETLVSYGLVVELRPSGFIRQKGKRAQVPVELTVYGPSWSAVDRLMIYSNGEIVWEQRLKPNRKAGVKLRTKTNLELPRHDAALVAVATGPVVLQPFWEVRKPYQPVSDEWDPMVLGVSSAIWIDGDADETRTAPLDYAQRLVGEHREDRPALMKALSDFDASVKQHALEILQSGP